MGLLRNFAAHKQAGSVGSELPLIVPRLHVPLGLRGGPAFLVYVVDGALSKGPAGHRAHELAAAIVAAGEGEPDEVFEGSLAAKMRDDVGAAALLGDAHEVVSDADVAHWWRLGRRAADVEAAFGVAAAATAINAVTSSALTSLTMQVGTPVAGLIAQHALRVGYVEQRAVRGATPLDTCRAGTLVGDPRLFVLSTSNPGPEMVYQWFTVAPLPSHMRTPAINKIAGCLDPVEFLGLTRDANQLIWKLIG